MNTREHYDQHLGDFYDWMVGDFEAKQQEQYDFFVAHHITPTSNGVAIDLGAGHGLQSIPLAKIGFHVQAVDFNQQLLAQLKTKSVGYDIQIIQDDLMHFSQRMPEAELMVCMGDTIAHLDTFEDLQNLITHCYHSLLPGGKLIASYRDYSGALTGTQRFIPVKSDENRILTCILDYSEEKVTVTDQLYEKTERGWVQKISAYQKIRVTSEIVHRYLAQTGFKDVKSESNNRMIYTIAEK